MSGKSVEDNKNNTKDAPNSYYESLNNKEKFEADEKLCGLVEKHPQLYDKNHPNYRKPMIIDATWKAVAASWGDTADNSKKRWNAMRSSYKQSLEKPSKLGKEYYLAKFMEFVKPYLNIVNGQTETETTADKNVVGDNKDLPQLTAGMRNMELNQKSETPKKTTQKPKTTTPKGGTSAVSAANEESETPKKTTQKPKTTTPKGGTSAVSAANEESETPKKNIQKPKTTTPKGGTSAVSAANEESETPKKNIQKPKTTTPKGGTSAVSAANEESETPKKNIQKPKTTTPKGGNGGGAVYNITINYTP